MMWKIYFWINTIIVVLFALSLPSLHVNPVYIIKNIGISLLDVAALFAYAYRKNILREPYWKVIFWILIFDQLIYYINKLTPLRIFPNAYLIKFNEPFNLGSLALALLFTIPDFYALFRLAYRHDAVFAPQQKPKNPHKLFSVIIKLFSPYNINLFQTALWGYSTILIATAFIGMLVKTGNSNHHQTNVLIDFLNIVPLPLFWLLVIIKRKRYRWNWWKKILGVSSAVYSLFILISLFDFTPAGDTGNGMDGYFITLLLFISLIIFGKEHIADSFINL